MVDYTKTIWTDEVPEETPVRFTIKDEDGNVLYDDVTIEVATAITTPGTQINAAHLNNIEEALDAIVDEALPKATVTAAGDLIYATGDAAVDELALGSPYDRLRVNDGRTAPEWMTSIGSKIYNSGAPQSIPDDTETEVLFNSVLLQSELNLLDAPNSGIAIPENFPISPRPYLVMCEQEWELDAQTHGKYTKFLINDVAAVQLNHWAAPPSILFYADTVILWLSAEDVVTVNVWHEAGNALDLEAYLSVVAL